MMGAQAVDWVCMKVWSTPQASWRRPSVTVLPVSGVQTRKNTRLIEHHFQNQRDHF